MCRVHQCPKLAYLEEEVRIRMQESLEAEDYYRLHTILWSLETDYRSYAMASDRRAR